MRQFDNQNDRHRFESLRASLMMLCFGFGVLAFLVVIDRTQWFHIRPASGTAAAMSNAGHIPGEDEAKRR